MNWEKVNIKSMAAIQLFSQGKYKHIGIDTKNKL